MKALVVWLVSAFVLSIAMGPDRWSVLAEELDRDAKGWRDLPGSWMAFALIVASVILTSPVAILVRWVLP